MKIGLYGGMANNMYVMSKALVDAGYDVMLVRDVDDYYPISQPVWEDEPFLMSFHDMQATERFTREYWIEKEKEVGWTPPSYLKVVESHVAEQSPLVGKVGRVIAHRMRRKYQGVVDLLMQNDLLIVCGTTGELLASDLGKPYIVWPHGGDIRIAAGLVPAPVGLLARLMAFSNRRKLEHAFLKADYVGSHSPLGMGGQTVNLSSLVQRLQFGWLPIPIAMRERAERQERIARINDLLSAMIVNKDILPITQDELICFIPSRVDFYWKGHDRLLRALKNVNRPVRLIFTGWGSDYEKAVDMMKGLKLDVKAEFLGAAMSKPLLYSFFDQVDLVIDQFCLGIYGTSAVEAMASGTPVMMTIDEDAWHKKGWACPPVINVASEKDIADAFQAIIDGRIDLDALSGETRKWFDETHSYRCFSQFVKPLFMKILAEHKP